MHGDKDHREQLDDFSKFIKRKLEDHRLPVDDLCWEEIEPRMKPRGRSFLWWIGRSVAAAAIAVLFLLLPFRQEEMPAERLSERVVPQEQVMTEETKVLEEDVISKEPVAPVDKTLKARKLIAAVTERQPVAEEVEKPVPESEPGLEPEKREEAKKQKPQDLNNYSSEKYNFTSPSKEEKKGKDWSVNASFGTGGHVSLGLMGDDLDYGTSDDPIGGGVLPPIVDPPFTNNEILPAEEYTDVNCALPLSFGLTVRKDFSRYIALETGLVYTYLSSRMTRGGKIFYNSRLDLHYLGVPVNLVVKLWDHPKWNIYLSGGMMLEKGLRSKLHQEKIGTDQFETLVEKKGIDGVQWSLNASAGISYRLLRDWSIYLEPRISYYFDNNQPVSIRTENSVIVGIGAGLRFEF